MSNSAKILSITNQFANPQVSEDLILQSRLLLNLTKSEAIDQGEVEESLRIITEAAAAGLDIERASVWLYNSDRNAIHCVDLFEKASGLHTSGLELKAADFPVYFKYLGEERTLPAHDAHNDPAFSEFSVVYFKPLNIFSLLDAPIRKNGITIGVVCCEKIGQLRKWSLTDESYAGSIADFVSRVFVAKDRATAQQSLQKMNENLEKLVEERTQQLESQRASIIQTAKMASLGEMAGGIAHEINTPLAVIQLMAGQLTTLVNDGELDLSTVKKLATNIETTTVRIGKIITSLRAFGRDVSDDPFQKNNLKDIVADTLSFCDQRFHFSDVQIEVSEIPAGLELECRSVQIQQVILNLLNNAFDAISNHPNKKWICIKAWQDQQNIVLTVTDSGQGIPEVVREKIMQPFFTTKEIGKGTGLGLSVASGLIRSHRGTLSLDTTCPNTCFKIIMPLKQ
ncbi:MAG: ATP-binding protein [Bdellovibrionota bacterium]